MYFPKIVWKEEKGIKLRLGVMSVPPAVLVLWSLWRERGCEGGGGRCVGPQSGPSVTSGETDTQATSVINHQKYRGAEDNFSQKYTFSFQILHHYNDYFEKYEKKFLIEWEMLIVGSSGK